MSTATVHRSKSRPKRRNPREGKPVPGLAARFAKQPKPEQPRRSGELGKIELAGGSPDRAALVKTEHPIPGLEPYKHVCPGCCLRVAWRPLQREEVARLFRRMANRAHFAVSELREGRDYDSARDIDELEETAIARTLGICSDCAFKLCSTGALVIPDTLDITQRIERLEYGVAIAEARS